MPQPSCRWGKDPMLEHSKTICVFLQKGLVCIYAPDLWALARFTFSYAWFPVKTKNSAWNTMFIEQVWMAMPTIFPIYARWMKLTSPKCVHARRAEGCLLSFIQLTSLKVDHGERSGMKIWRPESHLESLARLSRRQKFGRKGGQERRSGVCSMRALTTEARLRFLAHHLYYCHS